MIILVHGIGDSGEDLRPLNDALSGAVPTFAPTRRPLAADATFEQTVEDFVEQLGSAATGPAFFLGYSFGGLIAFAIARRHPQLVKGVIGLAPKIFYDERTMAHLRHIISADYLRKSVPHKVAVYEKRWGMDLETLAGSAMRMYKSFSETPPLSDDDLRAIAAPVLLVSGTEDPVVPEAEIKRLAELLPDASSSLFPGPAHPIAAVPTHHVRTAVLKFVGEVTQTPGKPTSGAVTGTTAARAWLR